MLRNAVLILLMLLHPFNTEPASLNPALPRPTAVFFSSVNLKNVLHWHAGKGTPSSTQYSVQYAIYGDSLPKRKKVHWRSKPQCRDTPQTWCDLSSETADLEEGYYARVMALGKAGGQRTSSGWTRTQERFDPKSNTTFGPPLVTVVMRDKTAMVHFQGPMKWRTANETEQISMATIYPQITYNLFVHNVQKNHTSVVLVRATMEELRFLDYDTEYCCAACASHCFLLLPCQRSKEQCFRTPQDPAIGQIQKIVLGIVVSAICVCIITMIGWLLYHSVGGKDQKKPNILERFSPQTPPLSFTPENITILFIDTQGPLFPLPPCSLSQSPEPQPIPVFPLRLEAVPVPLYAPQAAPQPDASWEEEFPEVDYGCVGVFPRQGEWEEPGGGRVYAPQDLPLLKEHQSQAPSLQTGQWPLSSHTERTLGLAGDQEVEDEEGWACADWDAETRTFLNMEGGMDGRMEGEMEGERRLRLELVVLSQSFEEEVTSERELTSLLDSLQINMDQ